MKKLLIFALAAIMLLGLTACGPEDKQGDVQGSLDASVTTADIPNETLPTVADLPVTEDTEPLTLPTEATDDVTSDDPAESSDNAVTTSSEATSTVATTTTAATTTKAGTTTKTTTTTAAKTTETAATTTAAADPDEGFEEEDLGWEIIENLDEWLLSMGFDTQDVNAKG